MKAAVADTSVISYLVLIDAISLLPLLFDRILIPQAVSQELNHPKAPKKVHDFIADPPSWLEIHPIPSLPSLTFTLDQGELEVIGLAKELGINLVLIDERDARDAAREQGLMVKGILGIVEQGARKGKIDLRQILTKLRQTNFRLSQRAVNKILEIHQQFINAQQKE